MGADAVTNTAMAAAWDGEEGAGWARDWRWYDRSVRGYHRLLLDAAQIGPADRVLDVGCGNGETSRDAARTAVRGAVLGVDLSTRMVERARDLARTEGLGNARFEVADAQVHPFGAGAYDVVVSRFGASFFAGPVAAFANIRNALRPGGRLVAVTWRGLADNEWQRCVFAALSAGRDLPTPAAGTPGPFGLADPDRTRDVLARTGFDSVEITPVDRAFWMGADGADAYGFLGGTGIVRGLTGGLDELGRGRALAALRAVLDEHETGDGVQFGSAAWLVSARRPAAAG